MKHEDIVQHAFEAFRTDAEAEPPLSLRGGSAVDSYDVPEPFDAALDRPVDSYLEQFASFGLIYLDARSWRHYLPRLIDYAFRETSNPRMAVEALIATLRPPDRYPPRLARLTAAQEAVVRDFLEAVALGAEHDDLAGVAQLALEEWWLPGARHRPSAEGTAALRAAPMDYRSVARSRFRLSLPGAFGSSGEKEIPEESRRVEVWSGLLCGDAPAVVAVNVSPAALRSIDETLARAAAGLGAATVRQREERVPGAERAQRLDGFTRGASAAEPERIALVAAVSGPENVLLTVRSWPREDVDAAAERIVSSLELVSG